MKKIAITLGVIMMLVTSPVNAFEGIIDVEVKIIDNSVHSNTVSVSLAVDSKSTDLFVKFVNTDSEEIRLNSGEINLGTNLISFGNIIDVVLSNNISSTVIGSINVSRGTWSHLKHVYVNWTFGQPAPKDNQGFGIGAMIAIEGLFGLSQDLDSADKVTTLAEGIRNTMFGSTQDLNSDGVTTTFSDIYGFAQYVYGMRDHIKNAMSSIDADLEKVETIIEKGYSNFSLIIDEGSYGDFSINVGSSDALLARTYVAANSALTANSSTFGEHANTLKSFLEKIHSFLSSSFNGVRNTYYSVSINDVFTLSDPPTSSSTATSIEESPFIMSGVFALLLRRKCKMN